MMMAWKEEANAVDKEHEKFLQENRLRAEAQQEMWTLKAELALRKKEGQKKDETTSDAKQSCNLSAN